MKGVVSFLVILLIIVVAVLGYYNMKQQTTIELLNEEIFEQARLRHELVLEKYMLQQQLEKLETDSVKTN